MQQALERANREIRVLHRVIDTVYSGGDLDDVLRRVVELVMDATEADACFLHIYDPQRDVLTLRCASEPYSQMAGRVELRMGEGVAGWVAQHQTPAVIVDDKRSDPRYVYIPELGGDRYTSMLSAPLVSLGGQLVGAFNVHTEARREFGSDDVAFVMKVATLVAAVIEHVNLFRALAASERAMQELIVRATQAQETERRRLASELHDGVTQHLLALWYRVRACERALEQDPAKAASELAAARILIDEALDEARTAVSALRPTTLDDLGLVASLEALVRQAREAGLDAELESKLAVPVPEHLELPVYRIAQEGLSNVRRHAKASRVRLTLSSEASAITIDLTDDGRGFDPGAVGERSYGLRSMSDRAEMAGGSLQVQSNGGTTLRVVIPRTP